MHKLQRPTEPTILTKANKAYDRATSQAKAWDEFDKDEVRKELKIAQNSLCAYCEIALTDNTRIDHFEPKKRDRELTFDWENLVLSCDGKDSCDIKKDNNFEDYWINPYEEDPAGIFTFRSNGKIKGVTEDAKKIIKDFGLDSHRLTVQRRSILSFLTKELLSDSDTIEYYKNMDYPMFPTAYTQIINNLSGE